MSTPDFMPQPDMTPSADTAAPMSELQRIAGVFFEPSKTFADLGRKQSWWVAWLLISVFALGWVYAVQSKIGWDQVTENAVKMSPKAEARLDSLSPDQRDKQLGMQAKGTMWFSWFSPLLILIWFVILAALWLAVYNFGLGAKVTFGRSLAIVMYAAIPNAIKSVLAIVFVFILNPETYNMQQPVASNLGALIDPMQHRFLFGLLSGVDLFLIWSIILTAIGFEQCTKVKRWTGFAVLYGVTMVIIAFFAAIGAAFS